MIDPMANLDMGGTSTGFDGGSSTTEGEGKDLFQVLAAKHNLKKMDEIRSFMGIVSGCFAGMCGLTGLEGLGMYYILSLCTPHLLFAFFLTNDFIFTLLILP